jgi:two-component system OmpR family sensor kinase
MTLRLRLTLMYTSLLGGTLLVIGALIYGLVSFALLDQVDRTLTQASNDIVNRLKVNLSNQFDPRSLAGYQPSNNLLFQVWGADRKLQLARPASLNMPLDDAGRLSSKPVFHTVSRKEGRYRVLSIPLMTNRGQVGVLQVSQSIVLIDVIQSTMASIIMIVFLTAVVFSGLAGWIVTGQALAPLALMTNIATQITRADDLQRRIPQSMHSDDEVGQLIEAFNQTLSRLESLFTAQRRFLADVSHELRTPLTVIKGNVGLMRQFHEVDEESLSSIESEVDRLTRMVGDLLILAQAESGRLPLHIAKVELDTVLLEVFQQMRLIAGDRLSLKITEIDQAQVMGDYDRIKQVVLNLVGNAINYTPGGGQVNLTLRKSGKMAQMVISDSGPGIPAADLPHIFERFYRAEKSRKRSPSSGFGLGLSIAYWIVRTHGGSIEVTSQEGKGSTFCVWLPLSEEKD